MVSPSPTATVTRFAIVGLEPSDGLLLKVMIERAAQRLQLFVDYAPAEKSAWVFFGGARPERIAPGSSTIEIRKGGESGADCLRFPPRISELLDLLSHLHSPPSEGWAQGSSHQLAVAVSHWLGALAPARLIRWRDGSKSLIRPVERRFHGQLPQSGLAQFREADANDLENWVARPSQSLEPWLWQLGLLSASGGLLPSVQASKRLRILVWPYLVAKAAPEFRLIATRLREQPRSVDELRALEGIDEPTLAGFLNAAHLAGFLVSEALEEDEAKDSRSQTSKMRRGVLSMVRAVRQRLGMNR